MTSIVTSQATMPSIIYGSKDAFDLISHCPLTPLPMPKRESDVQKDLEGHIMESGGIPGRFSDSDAVLYEAKNCSSITPNASPSMAQNIDEINRYLDLMDPSERRLFTKATINPVDAKKQVEKNLGISLCDGSLWRKAHWGKVGALDNLKKLSILSRFDIECPIDDDEKEMGSSVLTGRILGPYNAGDNENAECTEEAHHPLEESEVLPPFHSCTKLLASTEYPDKKTRSSRKYQDECALSWKGKKILPADHVKVNKHLDLSVVDDIRMFITPQSVTKEEMPKTILGMKALLGLGRSEYTVGDRPVPGRSSISNDRWLRDICHQVALANPSYDTSSGQREVLNILLGSPLQFLPISKSCLNISYKNLSFVPREPKRIWKGVPDSAVLLAEHPPIGTSRGFYDSDIAAYPYLLRRYNDEESELKLKEGPPIPSTLMLRSEGYGEGYLLEYGRELYGFKPSKCQETIPDDGAKLVILEPIPESNSDPTKVDVVATNKDIQCSSSCRTPISVSKRCALRPINFSVERPSILLPKRSLTFEVTDNSRNNNGKLSLNSISEDDDFNCSDSDDDEHNTRSVFAPPDRIIRLREERRQRHAFPSIHNVKPTGDLLLRIAERDQWKGSSSSSLETKSTFFEERHHIRDSLINDTIRRCKGTGSGSSWMQKHVENPWMFEDTDAAEKMIDEVRTETAKCCAVSERLDIAIAENKLRAAGMISLPTAELSSSSISGLNVTQASGPDRALIPVTDHEAICHNEMDGLLPYVDGGVFKRVPKTQASPIRPGKPITSFVTAPRKYIHVSPPVRRSAEGKAADELSMDASESTLLIPKEGLEEYDPMIPYCDLDRDNDVDRHPYTSFIYQYVAVKGSPVRDHYNAIAACIPALVTSPEVSNSINNNALSAVDE